MPKKKNDDKWSATTSRPKQKRSVSKTTIKKEEEAPTSVQIQAPDSLSLIAQALAQLTQVSQESLKTNKEILEKLDGGAKAAQAQAFDPDAFKQEEKLKPLIHKIHYKVQKYVGQSDGKADRDDTGKTFQTKGEANKYGMEKIGAGKFRLVQKDVAYSPKQD